MFSSQNSQVSNNVNYIEDVFSTYLYTGTGAAKTITNNIDLSTKGGLTWIKGRSGATGHRLTDTARGATKSLASETTAAEATETTGLTAFGTTGFTIGADADYNTSAATYVSWTFREQPKFFDLVTYTGTGSVQNIAHNLGSVPGCVITKKTSGTSNWAVYHRGITSSETGAIILNLTNAFVTSAAVWNNTAPTSTQFTVGTADATNVSGQTYVAYLFAHNAGGFGLTGTDNVISCDTFTTNGSGIATVNLGYEPQWLLVKANAASNDWYMYDSMRGLNSTQYVYLSPNLANAEGVIAADYIVPTATGFNTKSFAASTTYIYIAIRRGPMKVPTLGTSVFNPTATTATTGTVITTSFPVDAQIIQYRTPAGGNVLWQDRLRKVNTTATETNDPILTSNNSGAESSSFSTTRYWDNNGYQISASLTGQNRIYWNFRRAPGFFDEVCYTGTGSTITVTHNLMVEPELLIVKNRTASGANWIVNAFNISKNGYLDYTVGAWSAGNTWTRTATTLSRASGGLDENAASNNYVAYLFATVLNVSKVGSYTGNGTTQTIDCGFTSGARFVLIKRTDATGDWYVYDTARGMTVLTDPYLRLNSTAAEVATLGSVTTVSTGFALNSTILAAINVNAGTYIFLAIA